MVVRLVSGFGRSIELPNVFAKVTAVVSRTLSYRMTKYRRDSMETLSRPKYPSFKMTKRASARAPGARESAARGGNKHCDERSETRRCSRGFGLFLKRVSFRDAFFEGGQASEVRTVRTRWSKSAWSSTGEKSKGCVSCAHANYRTTQVTRVYCVDTLSLVMRTSEEATRESLLKGHFFFDTHTKSESPRQQSSQRAPQKSSSRRK